MASGTPLPEAARDCGRWRAADYDCSIGTGSGVAPGGQGQDMRQQNRPQEALASITQTAIVGAARGLLSLRALDLPPNSDAPRIFVANHVSHADFVALWTVLPRPVRQKTRPVAGADYWQRGALRRWIGHSVFNAVLIDRSGGTARESDPVETVARVLRGGENVIFFPEGTRNLTDAPLLPLKSGIFRLARAVPEAEVVPAWIVNLDRILPKGSFVPVPLNCAVRFGQPMRPMDGEDKAAFLARLSAAMLALSAPAGSVQPTSTAGAAA